jgi:hypothetical protein
MRVNINGVWHDAEQVPIQIELNDNDKKNIANMNPEAKNYVAYPKGIDWEDVKMALNI